MKLRDVRMSAIYFRSVTSHTRTVALGVLALSVLFVFGMAVYRGIDMSVFDQLPDSLLSMIGVGPEADVASLAYNAIFSTYGALLLGGIAIAIGAGEVAGRERDGTIGLLLANPISRGRLVVEGALALLTLYVAAGVVLLGVGLLAPRILEVSITGLSIGGFVAQMVIGTLFYGFLALAVGAWTGKSQVAIGISSGALIVSFLVAGLLPLISGWEEFARLSPWYYINAGDPLRNGLDIVAVAILGGASALFVLLAWIGINRRDLRSRSVNTRILDRLRGNTFTSHVAERVAGRTLVSKIWVKTISQFQAMTLLISIVMFGLMGLIMGPIYAYMEPTMSQLADSYPPEMLAFFGGGDFGTAEGFFQLETFGLVAPLAIMVVTIAIGAKSIAGEEKDQTLGLLLANPVSRSYVLTQKLIAMFIWGFVVAFATFAGVALANLLFNLEMDYLNILAICVQLLILGYLFGGVAALTGAAFGRVGLAIGVSAGAALVLQVVNGMAEINNGWWEEFTPFYWYNGTDPLNNGFSISGIIILTIATGITISASYPLLNRRDLRG